MPWALYTTLGSQSGIGQQKSQRRIAENTWNGSWSWTTTPSKAQTRKNNIVYRTAIAVLCYRALPTVYTKKMPPNCRLRQTKIRSQRLSTLRDKQSWREEIWGLSQWLSTHCQLASKCHPCCHRLSVTFLLRFLWYHSFLTPSEPTLWQKSLDQKQAISFQSVHHSRHRNCSNIYKRVSQWNLQKSSPLQFFEKPGVAGFERYYYRLDRPCFQLTSKSVFSIEYLKDASLNLEILWVSFESRAKIYIERFGMTDASKLDKVAHHFCMSADTAQPWLLNE